MSKKVAHNKNYASKMEMYKSQSNKSNSTN